MDLPTIYCIVDAPNVARRARMQARFAFHGLNEIVRFVEPCVPVDGRVNGIGDDVSHAAEAIRLQSHVAALRRFLDDSAFDDDSSLSAGAIVIEDDVVLHNRFVGRFAETMCNVPPGTPTVALGYSVTDWAGFSWSGVDSTCENLTTTNPRALRFPCAYWISRQEAARVVARLDRPLVEMPVGVTSAAIVHTRHALVAYPALALTEDFGRHGKRWFAHADYSVAERGARTTTIALCMIVKNEALVIERCLQSVRHLIDSWVICDTGSSDETIDVIERDLCDIPGRLHRTAWVDFGHNRSELLNLARGTADYLLLIDADQTISEMGCLPLLDDRSVDAYRLRHHDGIEYDVERLVRGDLPWRYVGRTHEYLTCDGHDTTSELLHAWQVIHHGDGGSRDDKFERDRVLLELSLAEDPDDPRTNFYLGQTLETLGEHALARHAYSGEQAEQHATNKRPDEPGDPCHRHIGATPFTTKDELGARPR